MDHPAKACLERPFVHYVQNQPQRAREHFGGLCEAKRELLVVMLCDRLERPLQPTRQLREIMWTRREIENYLCQPETLLAYARSLASETAGGPLFEHAEVTRLEETMRGCTDDRVPRAALRDRSDPWWRDTKASDDFLDRVLEDFFKRMGLPNLMRKTDYHVLARFVPKAEIAPEVIAFLDIVVEVASGAKPREKDV